MAALRTVLLIDDHGPIRETIAELLEQRGFSVLQAEGGESGLHLARQRRPDVIVSDYNMPDLNGLEVVKQVKESRDLAHIPVLVLSSVVSKYTESLCLLAGAFAYLLKESGITEIVRIIDQALAPGEPLLS